MNINEIVEKMECVSCGGCEYICPKNAVTLQYNDVEGLYRPIIAENQCVNCGLCVNVCPTKDYNGDTIMGNYHKLLLAHSTDLTVRKMATSGGVINSYIRFLLDSKIFDVALMLKHDPTSTVEASPAIMTAMEHDKLKRESREFASRYVVFPILTGLKNCDCTNKKIVIVGTPCQIKAARRAFKNNDCDIHFVGITCSGGMRYTATKEYKRKRKMSHSDMFYRGDGWPGTNVLFSGKKKIEENHSGSYFERMFSSQIFKNPGCRKCHDHFAELADISFCDFWNFDEIKNEKLGNSCTIVRTKRAQEYFDLAVENGYIEVCKELSEEEIISTQRHVVNLKKGLVLKKNKIENFYKIVDLIYRTKLYRLLGYRQYRKISSYFYQLCLKSDVTVSGIESKKYLTRS